MLRVRFVATMFTVIPMICGAGGVFGQEFPNKLIRIVTSSPGGSGDFAARIIAQALSSNLDHQVIVENRGGASGAIAALTLNKAAPDGYTLLVHPNTIWLSPMMQNQPYDPIRDFSPISLLTSSPYILVVHPSLPVKTVKELIALAKARPGELNYAGGNPGSVPHLSQELFKSMTGANIVHVPDKGGTSAISDLIGGQIQMTINDGPTLMPHVNSGKLRALAVTSAAPTVLAPRLPTVAASGLPGFEAAQTIGIFAPSGTPATVINRLNQETVRALKQADVKEKFLNVAQEAIGSTPEEFAAKLKSDIAKWGKVIKDAGIRAK